jgi:hypothetical protein
MTSRLERSIFAALAAAFAFGIATLWIPEMWPWAVFQSLVMTATAACLLLYAWKPAGFRFDPWLLAPLAVAAIGAVQLALRKTVDIERTRRGVFEWATYASAAYLAFLGCRNARLRRRALQLFVLAGAALALASTVQNYAAPGRVLWLFDSGYSDGVFGPFVYHTKLANFAELAIPAALWLAVTEGRRRALYITAAVVLAATVVAAASRGGVGILAVEFIVVGIAARRSRLGRSHLGETALATALVVAVATCGWEVAFERFASQNPLQDLRWPIASTSIEMAQQYWTTGSGLGTWSTVYPEFARFDAHIFINQAHCDWLQWLVEGGVLFPALMAVMLAAVIRSARCEWWTLGLAFVWLHGLVDYPAADAGVRGFTVGVLGRGGGSEYSTVREPRVQSAFRGWPASVRVLGR